MTLQPHPAVLTIWRLWLFLAALVPAFFASVFFRIGSGWWLFANACWLAPFLAVWAWYLPQRLRGYSYSLTDDRLILQSGVFGRRVKTVPRENVRFTTDRKSIRPRDAVCGGGGRPCGLDGPARAGRARMGGGAAEN